MGPQNEHLKQVQRDAVATTVRHFRDEVEDGTFDMDNDHLASVKERLLSDIDEGSNAAVGQPDASGKSAGGAAPSKEAQDDAKSSKSDSKSTNKTTDSRA